MNRELQNHKRSDCIKWIAVFVAVILLATGVAAALTQGFKEANPYCWFGHNWGDDGKCTRCGEIKPVDDEVQESTNRNESIVVEPHNNEIMKLSVARIASLAENQKSITATVNGTISSPKIDWTTEWAETGGSSQGAVTDYVTVTPSSDGATDAIIACLKPFEGIVYVRATIRDVGVSAAASVAFEGKASSLKFGTTTLQQSSGYYNVTGIDSYNVPLNLDNYWHKVGKAGNFSIVSITKMGTLNLVTRTVLMSSPSTPVESSPSEKAFSAFTRSDSEEFISFSISDSNLVVNCQHGLFGSYESLKTQGMDLGMVTPMAGTVYSGWVKSVKAVCYYQVVVKDSVSNLQATIKVGFAESMLSSVDLDVVGIVF